MMKKWLASLAAGLAVALATVSPVLAQGHGGHGGGGGHGGQGGQNSSQRISGVVSNLQTTTTGSTFTLLGEDRRTVTVTTTASTVITNRADSSTATLVNGLHVSVVGTRTTNSSGITATAIVVDNTVFGIVSNLQVTETGYAFDLLYARNQTLHIVTDSATTVTNASDGSAATLTEGQKVKVTGAYELANGGFVADSIVVDDRQRVARASGVISNLQTADGVSTFTLRDRSRSVTVTTTATTTITNFSDNSPATLANGQNVHVSGSYDEATRTLTATSVVVNDRRPPTQNQFVQGEILSIDAANNSFVVSVRGACVHTNATTVTVTVSDATVFTTRSGATITLADLAVGNQVKAEGAFDATTQTLAAVKVTVNR